MTSEIFNGLKKVVIITGGSKGLGREIALKLSPNHKVVILAQNEDSLKATAGDAGCDYIVCDITKYEQITKAVDEVLNKYGRIDVLINNAGIWIEGPLESNDPNYIHKVLEVNTLGTIWFSHAVILAMKKQKSGLIVNVVSQAGLRPKEERTVYNASKYAISGFTDSLNLELAKDNIGVAGIYPYKMRTEMFAEAGIEKDMSDALDPADAAKAVEFMLEQKYPNLISHLEIKNNSYKNKLK